MCMVPKPRGRRGFLIFQLEHGRFGDAHLLSKSAEDFLALVIIKILLWLILGKNPRTSAFEASALPLSTLISSR